MSKIFTNKFKINLINALIYSQPAYYIFIGRHTPYDDESVVPTLVDNIQTTYVDVYDQMLYAKGLDVTEASFMLPRIDWVYGTVYNQYSHLASGLYDTNFYVGVSSGSGYSVFKCLSNNKGAASTSAPDVTATSPNDDIYETVDGYQWKLMYTITNSTFTKFATNDYIPVFTDPDVSANAINGSIDYVSVDYAGSNYDSYTSGAFQSIAIGGNTQLYYISSTASANNNFYNGCALKVTSGTGAGQQRIVQGYSVSGSTRQIVINTPFDVQPTTSSTYEISPNIIAIGDGSGFTGRGIVNAVSNTIAKVEITSRGNNYTYASMVINANTGGVVNTATLTSIISPIGGHGYDAPEELGGHYLGLSTTFDSQDVDAAGKLFDVNDFRVIGVIGNPRLANVEVTYTGAVGTFIPGEIISQANTLASGTLVSSNTTVLRLTNVDGAYTFLPGNSSVNILSGGSSGATAQAVSLRNNGSADLPNGIRYLNQLTTVGITASIGTFQVDEVVTGTGNTATSNAVIYKANSSVLYLSNVKGTFGNTIQGANSGATASVTSYRPGDIVVGSGDVVYIENITAINKNAGQTEKIKAIIEF